MAGSVETFSQRVKNVQVKLAMIALVIMMGSTCIDVTLRFLFNRPIHGAYDIVEASLVVFIFHGMSASFFARKNIVIDVIDSLIGPRLQRILMRISDLVAVGLLALLIISTVSPALQAYEYGDRKLELGLPLWTLWVFAIVGLAGTLLSAFSSLFRPVAGPRGSAAHEAETS